MHFLFPNTDNFSHYYCRSGKKNVSSDKNIKFILHYTTLASAPTIKSVDQNHFQAIYVVDTVCMDDIQFGTIEDVTSIYWSLETVLEVSIISENLLEL